jgi:hypothetical protein
VCGQATCGLFICGDLLVWDEKDDNISFECWSSINKKSRMPRDPVNTLVKHDNNISAFCVKELEENKDFFLRKSKQLESLIIQNTAKFELI